MKWATKIWTLTALWTKYILHFCWNSDKDCGITVLRHYCTLFILRLSRRHISVHIVLQWGKSLRAIKRFNSLDALSTFTKWGNWLHKKNLYSLILLCSHNSSYDLLDGKCDRAIGIVTKVHGGSPRNRVSFFRTCKSPMYSPKRTDHVWVPPSLMFNGRIGIFSLPSSGWDTY